MKKIILMIMTIIFTSTFVYSLIHIILWYKDNKHTDEVTNKIINSIKVETIKTKVENEAKENEVEEKVTIDFKDLKSKNKDTRGWLIVNNTNINYPFVQSKDNSYYLNHSFDKKYNTAGWVFLDYRNNINNLDRNTIIYAHARKDKTMFGTLKYSLKKDWYTNDENHIIKMYTENEELDWQVFSTYHIKTESYYITTNFDTNDEYKKFINTLTKRSVYNYKTSVTTDDYILTLSSCYNDKEKVVLHAKLLNRKVIE